MKKLVLSILVSVALVPGVRAALYLEESFPYATGNLNAQPGWSGGSGSQITAGSLSYPGLVSPTVTSNKVNLPSTASTAMKSFNASPITGGSVYLSFLLKQTTLATSTSGSTVAGLDDDAVVTTGSGRVASALGVHVKQTNSTTYLVGIRKALGVSGAGGGTDLFYTGDSFVTGETVFIVAKYTFGAGAGDDTVSLWVNPATNSFGGIEPVASIAATNSGNTTDATQLQHVFVRCNSSTTSGINEIDDVRVGSTWAAVTPSGGEEPPATSPQPRITESFLSPSGLVLRGTNGVNNGVYQVLSSTAVTLPIINWPAIGTNLFDASGNFDCTNPVSSGDAQRFYRILVGGTIVTQTNSAPNITAQPQNLSVTAGQNATFNFTATGTAPLTYYWYFNTNTLLPWATANSLTVTNAQAGNVGTYHAVVSNLLGTATSTNATLTIVTAPPPGTPDGYATINGGTTGGAGGTTVTVSTFEDFEFYVDNNTGPFIVQVSGTINLGSSNVRVRDNKTIVGLGTNATLIGNLKVFGNNNVIIRNLTLSNPGVGDNDGLTLHECLNVWVDHCTFVDCDDGSLDIGHGADWLTVSWCHFYYTNPGNTHRFANLVGHSDSSTAEAEDTGKLHVTFHHNWWGQLVHERMPRVRFGRVHLFNNYYNSPGNNNCIRAARDSEILVENNYFDSVKNVWELYRTVGLDGKLFATNNIEVNTTWSAGSDSSSIQIPGTDILSNAANGLNPVPYAYTLSPANLIPDLVTNGAGAGKGPFAP